MIRRVASADPDQLAYRKKSSFSPVVGVLILLFGLMLLGLAALGIWTILRDGQQQNLGAAIAGILVAGASGGFFAVFGAWAAFSRSGVVIDRRRGVVTRHWGLLLPMVRKETALSLLDRVTISPKSVLEAYPVCIEGAGGEKVGIYGGERDKEKARQLGEEIARFAGLKLADASWGTEIVREVGELGQTLRERLLGAAERAPLPEPPDGLRCRTNLDGDTVVFDLPPMAHRWRWTGLAIWLALVGMIIPMVSLNIPKVAAYCVAVAAIALAVFLRRVMRGAAGLDQVRVSPREVRVTWRGLIRRRTVAIPAGRLVDLEIVLEIVGWDSAGGKRQPAILARSDTERVTFGGGLSVEELQWVRAVIECVVAPSPSATPWVVPPPGEGPPARDAEAREPLPDAKGRAGDAAVGAPPPKGGHLGVDLAPLSAQRPGTVGAGQGALVTWVLPGSTAERAGLLPGDVLVEADGSPVASPRDWLAIAAERRPHETVRLHLLRKEAEATREVMADVPLMSFTERHALYAKACATYARAVETNPRDAMAYYRWGLALQALRWDLGACEKYAKAVESDPQHADAHFSWGAALGRLGRHAEACQKYAKAVEINPRYAAAYGNWGLAVDKLGRHAEACQKFAKAVESDPRDAAAYCNWGSALLGMRKPAEACEKYAQAVEIDPRLAPAYCDWGYALASIRKRAEAEEKWNKAAELNPAWKPKIEEIRGFTSRKPRARGLLLWLLLIGGVILVVSLAPERPSRRPAEPGKHGPSREEADACVSRGNALEDMGKHAEACAEYAKAAEIDPQCAPAYRNWGIALARMGNRAEAEEKWKKAIELNPALRPQIEELRKQLLGKE